MTTEQLLEVIATLSGVTFVVTSMLAMGLGLTVAMILRPLRRRTLVGAALVANFVVAPALALGIAALLSLDPSLEHGLVLLATAAGAPFLPKLVEGARGDVAFAVGLMVVLMIATVVVLPFLLPWLLEDVEVAAWDIARSLIVLMLVPLSLALMVRARWPEVADEYRPVLSRASTLALLVLLVVGLGLNVDGVLDLIGTRGLLALTAFVAATFAVGFVAGGRDPGARTVVGLGTAQRNLSAALVVATQSFPGTLTLTYVLVGSVLLLLLLLPTALLLGRGARSST